jgi:hypothetical protein
MRQAFDVSLLVVKGTGVPPTIKPNLRIGVNVTTCGIGGYT